MYIYKQLDVIKFVSHLRQVGGFLRVLWVSSTNKTDIHDITEIWLIVALSTMTLTLTLNMAEQIYFVRVILPVTMIPKSILSNLSFIQYKAR
jgi:hypothetical protein